MAEADPIIDFYHGVEAVARHIDMPDRLMTFGGQAGRMLIHSVVQVLSDGEFGRQHERLSRRREHTLKHWFGEERYADGAFVKELAAMQEDPSPDVETLMRTLQTNAGIIAGQDLARNGSLAQWMNLGVTAWATRDSARTKEYGWALPRPLQSVLRYGPSFHGVFDVDSQIADLGEDNVPFEYVPISRTPFISNVLRSYFYECVRLERREGGVERAAEILETQKLRPMDNGIIDDTQTLLDEGRAGTFDIVVCSGLHYAKRDAVEIGVARAWDLTSPEGSFLGRFPTDQAKTEGSILEGSVTAEDVRDMGTAAGFCLVENNKFVARNNHGVPMASFVLTKA